MFGDVWKWAGIKHELKIGIESHRVPAEMPVALDDARFWVEHDTYSY